LRRIVLWLHRWIGLAAGLYLLLIGATGSLLVFRQELQAAAYPAVFVVDDFRRDGTQTAAPATVLRELERAYPGYRLSGIDWPTFRRDTFLAYVSSGSDFKTVFAHPVTGRVAGELPDDWIRWLQELHFDLLGGARGRDANGVGAVLLLAMTATGLLLWWPRFVHWPRSLRLLHASTGAWPSALLVMWALTGAYFAFPLTPVAAPESVPGRAPVVAPPDPDTLIERARQAAPSARPARLVMPFGDRGTYLVVVARAIHGDYDTSDELSIHFDRYSGQLLAVRDHAQRSPIETMRAWVLPLHAGTFGGLTVKVLWAIFALSLPALFITGIMMWLPPLRGRSRRA
jgi:uncharacterized iron-regulated membrane protein